MGWRNTTNGGTSRGYTGHAQLDDVAGPGIENPPKAKLYRGFSTSWD